MLSARSFRLVGGSRGRLAAAATVDGDPDQRRRRGPTPDVFYNFYVPPVPAGPAPGIRGAALRVAAARAAAGGPHLEHVSAVHAARVSLQAPSPLHPPRRRDGHADRRAGVLVLIPRRFRIMRRPVVSQSAWAAPCAAALVGGGWSQACAGDHAAWGPAAGQVAAGYGPGCAGGGHAAPRHAGKHGHCARPLRPRALPPRPLWTWPLWPWLRRVRRPRLRALRTGCVQVRRVGETVLPPQPGQELA